MSSRPSLSTRFTWSSMAQWLIVAGVVGWAIYLGWLAVAGQVVLGRLGL